MRFTSDLLFSTWAIGCGTGLSRDAKGKPHLGDDFHYRRGVESSVQEDNPMTWKTVSLTALLVGGLALVLSLIPRLPPKWKRLLNEMVLPLLFVSLTIDAVRDQDHFGVMFVIALWACMAGLYMKRLWVYLKRRHV
jgi:hypothetical protein